MNSGAFAGVGDEAIVGHAKCNVQDAELGYQEGDVFVAFFGASGIAHVRVLLAGLTESYAFEVEES
jgi:hypothetical protein